MGRRCRILAPASTSNLGSGFDSLGLALDIYLELKVEQDHPGGFNVLIEGEGAGILPDDGRNRVLKSAREVAGSVVDRAAWLIRSRIPMARGLGSSAAARAAGLAAGYFLRDGALPPRHKLFDGVVQTENHPDNAAATVFGGFRVAGRNLNGGWETWPGVLSSTTLGILLVVPSIPIPTHQARSILPTTYSRSACVKNLQQLSIVLSGLARGDWEAVRKGCRDQLHEPYRLPLVPGLGEALRALREHPDTGGAYLSGAGPILAAFLPDPANGPEVGDEAVEVLNRHGTSAHAQVGHLQDTGLFLETLGARRWKPGEPAPARYGCRSSGAPASPPRN